MTGFPGEAGRRAPGDAGCPPCLGCVFVFAGAVFFGFGVLGAEVLRVKTVPYSDPNHYQKVARRLADEIPGAIWSNQFDNTANRDTHEQTTGPEIWAQTDGRLDAFVTATGTGGTLGGVSRFLKRQTNHRGRKPLALLADPPRPVPATWRLAAFDFSCEGIGQID